MGLRFISQLDETDCGAACLAMISKYYKLSASIGMIREIAGTNTQGTSFAGMLQAAQVLGFTAHALFSQDKRLPSHTPMPAILHVQQGEQFHFMVVLRISKGSIRVADPAEGVKKLSMEELSVIWTGSFIILAPGPNFIAKGKASTPLIAFMSLLKPFKREFVEVFIASFALILFGITQFLYIRFIIDSVVGGHMQRTLHIVSGGMIVLVLVQNILNGIRQYTLSHLGSRVDLSIALLYFKKVLFLPQSFFDKRRVGEILTRLEDGRKIREVLSGLTLSACIDSLMILGVGIFLFLQSPLLTLLSVSSLPFFALVVILYRKPFTRNNTRAMSLHAAQHTHLVESLSGIFHIKAFGYEDPMYEQAEQRVLASLKQEFTLDVLGITQGGLLGAIEAVSQVLLFWVGGWLILQGRISIGQLISFNALLGYFIGPIKRLLLLQPQLQGANVAARRLLSILELPDEKEIRRKRPMVSGNPPSPISESETLFGAISFRNVSFSYGVKNIALQNFSLEIESGETVGIVGQSGSGKSTLVKLILTMYTPSQGTLLFDGRDSRLFDSQGLRRQIGYVPQDPMLFSGTIMDNLIIGLEKPHISDVLYACTMAQALPFIQGLPDGFATEVGDRGAKLSGGERQRLAIARALIRKPRLLILDEATSALDTKTESGFQMFLEGLRHVGTTILIIAHRLTTVQNCNRIVVLENGRVQETGTHQELLQKPGGQYRRLWECQKQVTITSGVEGEDDQ